MSSCAPTFTVFTPTFNRAHTLHRVYESLRRQTCRSFEWLVVDDGSEDDTPGLVDGWTRTAAFPLRYLRQPNRGKHVAFNAGVRHARGRLFLPLDSDDACVPHALERFLYHWHAVPQDQRTRFTGVTALCMDEHGRIVGRPFPRDVFDSDSLEMRYRFGATYENWGFHRTSVLRRYPFPEDVPPGYVPEGIVWWRIARAFRTRFVNEALRVYYTDQPSLMRGRSPARHAASGRLADLIALNEHLEFFGSAPLLFCRTAAQYVRLSAHARVGAARQCSDVKTLLGRALWCLAYPVGMTAYFRDRRAAAQAPAVTAGNEHADPEFVSRRA